MAADCFIALQSVLRKCIDNSALFSLRVKKLDAAGQSQGVIPIASTGATHTLSVDIVNNSIVEPLRDAVTFPLRPPQPPPSYGAPVLARSPVVKVSDAPTVKQNPYTYRYFAFEWLQKGVSFCSPIIITEHHRTHYLRPQTHYRFVPK